MPLFMSDALLQSCCYPMEFAFISAAFPRKPFRFNGWWNRPLTSDLHVFGPRAVAAEAPAHLNRRVERGDMSVFLRVLLLAWLGCAGKADNGSTTEVCESCENVLLQTAPKQRSAQHSLKPGMGSADLVANGGNMRMAGNHPPVPQDEEVHQLGHAVEMFVLMKRPAHGSVHVPSVKIPRILTQMSKDCVVFVYIVVAMICPLLLAWCPKHPQDSQTMQGCPKNWLLCVGCVYACIYVSADHYVPNLPQMEADLAGSSALMCGTVQLNLVVKSILGLLVAGLSDRIGRRPVVLPCLALLSLASLCCACAGRIEWFFAAHILQGIGESVEPVLFATSMARDYFSNPKERFSFVVAMEMMAIIGTAVAPLYGGLCAAYINWRLSFLGMAVVWGLLAAYAFWAMVESRPEGNKESYLNNAARILDPQLLCLLLTESWILGQYFMFNTNVSYLMEVSFGRSAMATSTVMLIFGVVCGLGGMLIQRVQLGILRLSQVTLFLLALFGIISMALGLYLSEYLWCYLVVSFLQASVLMMAWTCVSVLFMQELEDCAGMASSFETIAESVPPALLSAIATKSMIEVGPKGLTMWQAGTCIAGGIVFWLGFGRNPPTWALDLDKEADRHEQ
ncbi:ydgK [Symbiodinium sp. CCMP2592]|nr:ydgK [Symbiodinium sp. CCMP2592]